jgi:FkbM family methyltransferase
MAIQTGRYWSIIVRGVGALKTRYSTLRHVARFARRAIGHAILPAAHAYVPYAGPFARKAAWRLCGDLHRRFRVRTTYGFEMSGNTVDLIQRMLYWFGVWEPNLSAWVHETLKNDPTRTFLDIGANVGYYSVLAGRVGANVVSFEPHPEIYNKLLGHLELNGLAKDRAINVAACDRACELQFFPAPVENCGRGTIVPENAQHEEAFTVQGVALAETLTPEEVSATRLIKIDVEGAELGVLAGFAPVFDLLPNDVEFVIEADPPNVEAVIDLMHRHGFIAYYIFDSCEAPAYLAPQALTRPRRLRKIPPHQVDLVFSKRDQEYL